MILENWRDAEAYEALRKLPLSNWAWQFLRRNPEYQKDYDSIVRPYSNHHKNCISQAEKDVMAQNLSLVASNWGIFLFAPAPEENDPLFICEKSLITVCNPSDDGEVVVYGMRQTEILLKLDLSVPASELLGRLKEFVISEQNKLKKAGIVNFKENRNRIEKYPFYLRCLDAEAAGASIALIASVTLPNRDNVYPDKVAEKNVRNALTAAKHLRDHDWRSLFV